MYNIVVGLNFGDEGKGTTTNFLCKDKDNTIVVRFNGGHQAGHTVELENGTRHVFQSFGSGTLKEIPTYWSKYCVMYPIGFINEYRDLTTKTKNIKIYFDPLVQVTTIYDFLINQKQATINNHGSVGVGVGCTYERNESPYKLYFKDLFYPEILKHKLDVIKNEYYKNNFPLDKLYIEDFEKKYMESVEELSKLRYNNILDIAQESYIFNTYKHIVFEGAQGILLDQEHGFFPHVTRSNTTSKNALEMIYNNRGDHCVEMNYVTRAYFTRHGAGPFPSENIHNLNSTTKDDTNIYHAYQKHLRYGALDLGLMDYALLTDKQYHQKIGSVYKNLFITCIDHIEDKIPVKMLSGVIKNLTLKELCETYLRKFFNNIYTSDNPYSKFKIYVGAE